MGPGESGAARETPQMGYQSIDPITMPRTGKEKNSGGGSKSEICVVQSHNILKTSFAGTWSVDVPDGPSPEPRTGHFFASDPANGFYAGYGETKGGLAVNDVWSFSFANKRWTKIAVSGDFVSPRSGSSSCLVGDNLFVFGGFSNGRFFSDLHFINVRTGETRLLSCSGREPCPRAHAYLAYNKGKLYVFGGSKETLVSDFFCLQLDTLVWSEIENDVMWSTSATYTTKDSKIYSYGGMKGNNLLVVDLEKETANTMPCQGACPVSEPISGGLVFADNFLFCFGGKNKGGVTLVYALELDNLWWFVYYMVPDHETTSITDGQVSSNGIFLLPSAHSFGSVYDTKNKAIMSFLGFPFIDPPPISRLNLGDSLPLISLRKDLLQMLR